MLSRDDELFPIVDVNGNVVGSATRGECHGGSMLLHPVVHLHIFAPGGRIYLQKRSMSKDIQPGKWDTAVGGHVDYGESVRSALLREAREELGVDASEARALLRYPFRSEVECELVNSFYVMADDDFTPVKADDEIDDARFWSIDEVEAALGKGVLTPNFEQEFEKIKELIPL
ncbi:MAG: NUDIX domain-containing protein [Pseudoflavonifractor sp.]|nr:NUDIX domain-containing protein [Pseudoflavonifractor sp.]